MKQRKQMSIKTFERALNRFGADFSRWPAGQAAEDARILIAQNDKARVLYREAQAVERGLDFYTAPSPDKDLAQEIITKITALPHDRAKKRRNKRAFARIEEAGFGFRRRGLKHAAFFYGAALASALLFLVIVPRLNQPDLATSRLSLPVRTTAVEPLLAEWDAMSLAAQQELQQAETLFSELKISSQTSDKEREAIESFLEELEEIQMALPKEVPEGLWQSFAAGYIRD